MKKLTAILLTLMLLLCLSACGGEKETTNTDGETTAVSEHSHSSEEETTEEQTTQKEEFEEVSLIDDEYMSLKVIDTYTDADGYGLKVQLENPSQSEDYCYTVEQCSVNGISVDTFFYVEVSAGKKAVESISIYDEYLKDNGISEFTDIEMTFTVQKDVLEENIAVKTVHFYPLGEDKAEKYVRESKDTDVVLIDNEYITLTATGMKADSEWECRTLYFYIENKCDEDIMLDAESASVNDFMLDPLYADTIPAGKCKFSAAEWYDYDLEENNIETIEKIEIDFKGYAEVDYESILESLDGILTGEEADDALFEQTVVYRP